MKVCGVVFKDGGKPYYFDLNNIEVEKDDYVIVENENGEQYAKVKFIEDQKQAKDLKKVLRAATKKDYDKYLKTLKESQTALNDAKKFAQKLNLNMQFVDSSFTFDHKQLTINFISDERVDFRELVKMLANKYKVRIDLHQIGVRDKAKTMGGIGPCGRKLCCAGFLNHLDTISINMAKNQNIALNPTKINGACGRLLCCLSYEDEMYEEYRKELKTAGQKIKYQGKEYTITSVDLLSQTYTIELDGTKEKISANEVK